MKAARVEKRSSEIWPIADVWGSVANFYPASIASTQDSGQFADKEGIRLQMQGPGAAPAAKFLWRISRKFPPELFLVQCTNSLLHCNNIRFIYGLADGKAIGPSISRMVERGDCYEPSHRF
jgi:hypothetical protein